MLFVCICSMVYKHAALPAVKLPAVPLQYEVNVYIKE